MPQKDYYNNFSVPRTATDDDIKKAYASSHAFHPIKNPGKEKWLTKNSRKSRSLRGAR